MTGMGHTAWNKGLTKDTDPRVASYGKQTSETKKSQHKVAWNKGLRGVQIAWNKGKPMSEKSRKKLSESQKTRYLNPDTRKKVSDFMQDYYSNPENLKNFIKIQNTQQVKENKSKALKGLKRSPEAIKNISISQIGKKLSDEHKKKISNTIKITNGTPEARDQQSKRSKKFWSDPEFKIRQIKMLKELHNRLDVIEHHAYAYAHRPHKNTGIEIILENILKSLNVSYEAQKVIPFGVSDFFIPTNICLFADGYDHTRPKNIEHDKKQTEKLKELNYIVLRFWDNDLKNHPENVKNEISKHIPIRI
jgi:very-short-patch-repair endonuclease